MTPRCSAASLSPGTQHTITGVAYGTLAFSRREVSWLGVFRTRACAGDCRSSARASWIVGSEWDRRQPDSTSDEPMKNRFGLNDNQSWQGLGAGALDGGPRFMLLMDGEPATRRCVCAGCCFDRECEEQRCSVMHATL